MGSVNEHVVELVPVPVFCITCVSPPVPVQDGGVPEGAVMVHVTFPLGWGSLALAGVAPTVALNESVEPGWAGEGEELEVMVVNELAAATLATPDPPGPVP